MCCATFEQDQLDCMEKTFGRDCIADIVQALPNSLWLMSACSGTGMFEMVTYHIVAEFNKRYRLPDKEAIQAGLYIILYY